MDKVKNFFIKIGVWFKNHAPTRRRIIQVYAALLFNCNIKGFVTGKIYQGGTKSMCVPGLNCYSCPGAVGACPLGALQDSLALSKTTTPYYILGILALFGLILARTICGFLCPLGFGQELLHKIKTPKVKKNRVTRVASYFKYVLLAVLVIAIPLIYNGVPAFCKYVCPAGTFEGGVGLLSNPNNSSLFGMLDYLFSWKFVLLVIFIVGSIFFYRFFCRFFCPLGAILGFFNKWALIGVKLDDKKCVDCGRCLETCQMDIRRVGDHECINCGACIPACPTDAISWKGSEIFLSGITKDQPAVAAAVSEAAVTDVKPAVTLDTAVDGQAVGDAANEPVKPVKRPLTKVERVKKRNFILEVSAWVLAGVILISALVYYNFIVRGSTAVVYQVGDRCPDFTLSVYDTAGAYGENGEKMENYSSLEVKNAGKVMVVNFWYTTCDPCKEEIPEFNEVQIEYGEKISVVIVHIVNRTTPEQVQAAISGETFEDFNASEYELIFAQDTSELDLTTMLGSRGTCPFTTIVDADGRISSINQGKMSKDDLKAAIDIALGE